MISWVPGSRFASPGMTQCSARNTMTNLTDSIAEKFAALALAHVSREFPNKMDHVIASAADVIGPRAAHPIFFGSFDWHSCVHGYWLLARLKRRHPDFSAAPQI